jgi:hypothetical protein
VPEVIDEGITGFVVDTEEAAIAAIKPAASLDRRRIRATFERRFAARRMAEDYRRSYERLLGAGAVVPQRNLPCRPGTVTTPSSG